VSATLVVAAMLVVVASTAEFPGALFDISWIAILLIGPVDSVIAGVIGGLHRRLPSPLEVIGVAYISVISAGLGTWLTTGQLSDQALTNSVVGARLTRAVRALGLRCIGAGWLSGGAPGVLTARAGRAGRASRTLTSATEQRDPGDRC
jgi:hypothetical protein